MLDDKTVQNDGDDGDDGSQEFETQVRTEQGDGEELYDKDGKPLPWTKSKRFRRLYGEAKDGRRVVASLRDMGLTVKDLPKLREELSRLDEYDKAREEYERQRDRGETDDDDDEDAREAAKTAKRLRARLKALGVKMVEDDEPQETPQHTKQLIVNQARDLMAVALEDTPGFEELEVEEKRERLAELDFKIGRKLRSDAEALRAFQGGSLAPIRKYIKEILGTGKKEEKPNLRKPSGDRPVINKTTPRVGSGPGSQGSTRKPDKTPVNVKEANEQVVEALRDMRRQKAAENNEE